MDEADEDSEDNRSSGDADADDADESNFWLLKLLVLDKSMRFDSSCVMFPCSLLVKYECEIAECPDELVVDFIELADNVMAVSFGLVTPNLPLRSS